MYFMYVPIVRKVNVLKRVGMELVYPLDEKGGGYFWDNSAISDYCTSANIRRALIYA